MKWISFFLLSFLFTINLLGQNKVYDMIASSPDHTILETAIDLAGLKDALNGDGPFTVFAPTDAAIQALPEGVLDALLADPSGALKDILLYHVVGAQALSSDLSNEQEIQTLLANKNVRVTIRAEGVFINDAKVIVADLVADNGVIHVIDAVLTPITSSVNNLNVNVNIYPNPFTEFIHIDFPNPSAQTLKIELLDVQGKLIQSFNSGSTTERIYVKAAPGTYILKIVNQDAQQEFKLIKK
ncbi:MAG: fasciclin domain-containing protein [Saprospiraceae bacterium]|nr:fasciclin domain-containing protein [Saprospiraceae bacterium]